EEKGATKTSAKKAPTGLCPFWVVRSPCQSSPIWREEEKIEKEQANKCQQAKSRGKHNGQPEPFLEANTRHLKFFLGEIAIASTLFVFKQLVLKRIDQCQPACFDDVFADADGAPDAAFVAPFDHDADAGRCLSAGVDDAHLVVGQVHLGQARVKWEKSLAQCAVERVDGTVAFADRV